MNAIQRLTLSAYGMHLADQIALVAVPLVAALVFDAPAQIIGVLVACQSMAHLLGSLPFGLIIDRAQARTVAIAAALISCVGFGCAAASVFAGSLVWFGASVTAAGFGVVLFVLVSLSIVPKIIDVAHIAKANSRLDLARALCSFAVPLAAGLLVTAQTADWVFALAAAGGVFALAAVTGLPAFSVTPQTALPRSLKNIFAEMRDDLGTAPANGDLSHWARQGVLLLNSSLSVLPGQAGAHAKWGWDRLARQAVAHAQTQSARPLAFILWGGHAQKALAGLPRAQDLVIATAHPSPLSARRGFFGSRPFSRVNDWLAAQGAAPIDWALSQPVLAG